jgi:hypothetical protein
MVTVVMPAPNSTKNALSRGWRRMRELATAYEVERAAEEQALLNDLGHEPSRVEELLIENASGLAVRARRLRRIGKAREADDVTRLLLRVIGRLGVKPGEARPPEAIEDYLRRTEAASAGSTCDEGRKAEQDDPDAEERMGEARNGGASA